jgi:hypothetical protein
LNVSDVANLVGTTSNISFTWPITFERRHHSPPYSILYGSFAGVEFLALITLNKFYKYVYLHLPFTISKGVNFKYLQIQIRF